MFRWIIGASLRLRVMVVSIAVVLMGAGIAQLKKMPVDVFPEFEGPTVEVQTEALGLSAEQVESLVTLNLEELLSGVPWLESIRSESVTGLSSVVLKFARDTDPIRARQVVQERLTSAYLLPNVASTSVMLQPRSATSRFMLVGISSDKIEPTELSLLARWTIKPKLLGVPGVANVAIWGQRIRQLHVQIDPLRLRDARLRQEDIFQSAGDAMWTTPLSFLKGSAPATGGWIDNQNQRLGVHHRMPVTQPEDMAQVALAPPHLLMSGKTMNLGDVTEVTFDHPPIIGDAFVNNGKGLMLVIEKLPSADTLEVTRGVEKALEELQGGLPGVQINSNVFRLASYVDESMANLFSAVVIGLILVCLILLAFLFNWRTALINFAAIPVSILAAVMVLQLSGATLNTMLIAGLVLGLAIIIDDAVVDVEKLTARLRDRQGSDASIAKIIYEATFENRSVLVYAMVIVIFAVAPILVMGGVSGSFFEPLAISYALAVVVSMIVGLTLTPALSYLLLAKGAPVAVSPLAAGLRAGFSPLIRAMTGAPRAIFAMAFVLVVLGLALWPLMGQSLLPSLKEKTLVVNWATAPGTSAGETYRITSRVSRELDSLPGVRNVGAHIGRAIAGDQVVGINNAQIWVDLDPAADYDETVAAVQEIINGYPGVDRSLGSYLQDTISRVLTGETEPIVVRIFGHDWDILREKANDVKQALADVDGLVDLRVVGQVEEPEVRVAVDLDKAGRASVKPGDVRRSSSTVFSGLTVGHLFEDQKMIDVVVWGAPETRQSLDNIGDVLVEKSDHHHVRLGDVADVRVVSTPTVIKHDGISRYMDVVANVSGRDLGAVTRDVENRLKSVKFPLEYHPELLGEYIERQGAQQRLGGLIAVALLGIFLLFQACFRSWRLALIGFLALPAAVAGGVLAGLLTGGAISLGSLVGFLAVIGIAARQSILLINRYQQLETQDGMAFGLELVLRGIDDRIAPLLASTATIIGALLPMMIFGNIAGLEILQSTAIVISGGLVAATLFNLFVTPALYLVIAAGGERQRDIGLVDA